MSKTNNLGFGGIKSCLAHLISPNAGVPDVGMDQRQDRCPTLVLVSALVAVAPHEQKQVLAIPWLDQRIVPDFPAKHIQAVKAGTREKIAPNLRPSLVEVTCPALPRNGS